MEKMLQRLISSFLMMVLLTCVFSAQASSTTDKFDLSVFKKQYSVSIDDMEARGFISLKNSPWPNDSGYSYNHLDSDKWLYSVEPDIYLANYGTSMFYPLPRIWFTYYGKDLYTYQSAIFKIGETTYTFSNIFVSQDTFQYQNLFSWSRNFRYETKSVCLCTKEYKNFMDAFIANGTKQIKVRLKGNKDTIDFMIPSQAQKDIVSMFKDFKNAGGYNLLPSGT